jgi:hypothetical protein
MARWTNGKVVHVKWKEVNIREIADDWSGVANPQEVTM